MVVPRDWWLQGDLDAHWTVAYRLAIQSGRPVIAEVRLFPREPGENISPGEWDGRFCGVEAQVPRDGITARLWRRVTPGTHLRELPRLLSGLAQRPWYNTSAQADGRVVRRAVPSARLFTEQGWLGTAGFQPPSARGRAARKTPRHSDAFYAQVAVVR